MTKTNLVKCKLFGILEIQCEIGRGVLASFPDFSKNGRKISNFFPYEESSSPMDKLLPLWESPRARLSTSKKYKKMGRFKAPFFLFTLSFSVLEFK